MRAGSGACYCRHLAGRHPNTENMTIVDVVEDGLKVNKGTFEGGGTGGVFTLVSRVVPWRVHLVAC